MNKDRERGGGIGLICRKVKLHCGISAPSTSKPPPWRIYSLSSFCYFNFKLRILCVSCVCGYRESLRKNFTPLCALTNEHLHVSQFPIYMSLCLIHNFLLQQLVCAPHNYPSLDKQLNPSPKPNPNWHRQELCHIN